MFPSKYLGLIFIILYNLTILSEAAKELSGLGTNFLLKGYLNWRIRFSTIKNWSIEESVFGDEKNMIVTLITEEMEGIQIKMIRDFKTQNISLICVQNECGRNTDLLNKNLKGFPPGITQIVKATLLLGPYRMILCEASGGKVSVGNLITYPCDTLYLKLHPGSARYSYIVIRDSFNRDLHSEIYDYVSLFLSIQQTESLVKANVSISTKGIHYKFNESITKYNGLKVDKEHGTTQLNITSLDSVISVEINNKLLHLELVYDRKFGLKYIPSGHDECIIESSSFDGEFNYVALENFVKEFTKELYLPKNPVKSHSKKLLVETEHNVMVDNVKYDLAVKTYLGPHDASRFLVESGRLEDCCVQMDLYSKSVPNEISSNFNLTEVRVTCLLEISDHLDREKFHRMIDSYNKCFKDKKDKVILRLEIKLLNHLLADKIYRLQADIPRIKDRLRSLLVDKLNISSLRINWIKLSYTNSHIMAKVEIFDSFVTHFETKKGTTHRFNIKSTEPGQFHTSTSDECLHLQASKVNLSYVITCKTGDYLCLGIAHGDSLPDENENGLDCVLFNNSDQRLTKLLAGVPLKVIGESYFNLNGSRFNYSDTEFAIVDVTIEDDIHLKSSERPKPNSNFSLFLLFSILISIMIFVKFALDYKLSQSRSHPLGDSVAIELHGWSN